MSSLLTMANNFLLASLFSFLFSVSCGYAWNGTWYNHLGSGVKLRTTPRNEIHGEYWTAVETTVGAAGWSKSFVTGYLPDSRDSTIGGFSVVWKEGLSVTSWSAHLTPSERTGESEILSSWVLRKRVEKCGDLWQALLISQDFFTKGQESGLKSLKAHRQKSQAYVEERPKEHETSCSAVGDWYEKDGTKLTLSTESDNLKGILTLRPKFYSLLETAKLSLHGRLVNPRLTFGFTGISDNRNSITTFTGQCIKCEGIETLHLSWLMVKNAPSQGHAPVFGTMTMNRNPPDQILEVDDDGYLHKLWKSITSLRLLW